MPWTEAEFKQEVTARPELFDPPCHELYNNVPLNRLYRSLGRLADKEEKPIKEIIRIFYVNGYIGFSRMRDLLDALDP